jgi:hypothetical protein
MVAREYSSMSVCGSFALIYTSIRAFTDDKVHVSVFHRNSVSIPSDRMVIEVHDYALLSKKISAHNQNHMCLMTQNGNLHEMPKKIIFVS